MHPHHHHHHLHHHHAASPAGYHHASAAEQQQQQQHHGGGGGGVFQNPYATMLAADGGTVGAAPRSRSTGKRSKEKKEKKEKKGKKERDRSRGGGKEDGGGGGGRRSRSSSARRDKKGKKRSSSRRRRDHHHADDEAAAAPVQPSMLVPDKEAYVRLLTEVAGWSDAQRRNIVLNSFNMMAPRTRRRLLDEMQAPPEARPQEEIRIPLPVPGEKEVSLLSFVNVSAYDCRVAKIPEGSYIIASRLEWGYFALYRKATEDARDQAAALLQSLGTPFRKAQLPTWAEILKQTPVLVILFLEITQLADVDTLIKISTLNGDKALKLQFAAKDVNAARQAIKTGHVQCRLQKRIQGARHPSVCEFYVDGEEFFPALGDALMSAENEIFMAAWWLSPYVFLRRSTDPSTPVDQNFRLDNLLQKKAFQGVRICILLYQEIERATALTSLHTKTYLESLHGNIKVVRHRGALLFTHHQKFTIIDWRTLFIGGLDPCYGRWDTCEHPLFPDESSNCYPGLDYRNPLFLGDEATSQVKTPFLTSLNRRTCPRLPWHDVHIKLEGKIAYSAGLNFVQRWHHHVKKASPEAVMIVPDTSSLYDSNVKAIETERMVDATLYRSMGEWSGNRTPDKGIFLFYFSLSLSLSLSLSCLFPPLLQRTGIESAYLDLIRSATDYIYLENQYFISSVYGPEVTNKIAQSLVDKIVEAYHDNKTFRCIMLIQPHGEGDPVTDQIIRSIMYFQNQTIARMHAALVKMLGTPEEVDRYLLIGYIQQHGVSFDGKPVSSPIYIHSKFIVADDTRFIVGSANINDRSFNGDRDSEMAVLVAKPAEQKDGLPYSEHIRGLRIRLWTEHFGLTAQEVLDPTSDTLWDKLRATLTANTEIYERMFPATPSNRVTSVEDAQRQAAKPPNDELLPTLQSIRGHAVLYPWNWMSSFLPAMIAQVGGTALLV